MFLFKHLKLPRESFKSYEYSMDSDNMTIIETAKSILKEGPICDACLGRQFGKLSTGLTNAQRGFAIKTDKATFIGREAVLRIRDAGLRRRLLQFRLTDAEPLLFHNEAIVRDGRIVGTLTSGNYGHYLGGAIGLGYVPCEGERMDGLLAARYEIEIAGERFPAEASLKPLYDPNGERLRL